MANNKKSNWQFVDQVIRQTNTDFSPNNPIWRKYYVCQKPERRNFDATVRVELGSADSFSSLERKEPDFTGYNLDFHKGFCSKPSISDNPKVNLNLAVESKGYDKKKDDDYLFINDEEAKSWRKDISTTLDDNLPKQMLRFLPTKCTSFRSINQGLPIFHRSNYIPKINGSYKNIQDNINNSRESEPIESLGEQLAIVPRPACLVKYMSNQIPLHIATKKGDLQTIEMLIKACPKSLSAITPLKETALHLALKHDQVDAFEVLLKSILGFCDYNILEMKDSDGNNVLHIATTRKQMQILELLLYKNRLGGPLVQLYSQNNSGLTALELHRQHMTRYDDDTITNLLERAEARTSLKYPHLDNSKDHHASNSLHLVVTVLVAGSIYSSIFNFTTLENHINTSPIKVMDVFMHPELLPHMAYIITLMTIAFTSSIASIAKVVRPITRGWSFFDKAFFWLALSTFFLSYAFTTRLKMPIFLVTCAPGTISSFWFMWLLNAFILVGALILWFITKMINKILSNQSGIS